MSHFYRPPKSKYQWASLLLGALATAVLFVLVPLVQSLDPERPEVLELEEINLAAPPPPSPPTADEPPPSQPEEDEPPELEVPPPMLSLEQIEISLNPGIGGDVTAAGLRMDFDFETESAEEMMAIFEFSDLDKVPHITRRCRFRYPPRFRRSPGEGFVKLLILLDSKGRVSVEEVLDASHPEFIPAVEACAESTRFSPPLRNGKPVRARYEWKFVFPLDG